ncbi:MAG TPA: hypothetical protein VLI92_02095, partial [Candidatus Saccharimonadales bacterium]|nr:hypothetical protein [Candidatus Saccharimonadales bacterium]
VVTLKKKNSIITLVVGQYGGVENGIYIITNTQRKSQIKIYVGQRVLMHRKNYPREYENRKKEVSLEICQGEIVQIADSVIRVKPVE